MPDKAWPCEHVYEGKDSVLWYFDNGNGHPWVLGLLGDSNWKFCPICGAKRPTSLGGTTTQETHNDRFVLKAVSLKELLSQIKTTEITCDKTASPDEPIKRKFHLYRNTKKNFLTGGFNFVECDNPADLEFIGTVDVFPHLPTGAEK